MVKKKEKNVKRRFPVVNGIFYPDSEENLTEKLVSWGLKKGSEIVAPGGQAVIVPHGAWDISGNIASAAFSSIQAKKEKTASASVKPAVHGIKRVILLGPCHSYYDEGIYLSESVSFQTPFGDLPVDKEMNRQLASCSTLIRINDIPHLSEHSLEVILPMVKYCLSEISIVPVLVSGGRPVIISGLARALRIGLENYMGESLIIISSNASRNPEPAVALSMADEFRRLLEQWDAVTFLNRFEEGQISPCGGALVGALMESGLLEGKGFSALSPLVQSRGEEGETIYYGAFGCSGGG